MGTVAWRLAIALSGFVGWWLYGHDLAQVWFLTQAGNLLTAVVYLGLAIAYPLRVRAGVEAGQARVRGSMTLLLLIIMVVYLTMMGGDLSNPADLFCHLITPLLALIDWCLVGRSQNRVLWWHPLLWLIIPTVWLVGYSATGGYAWVQGSSPLYSFLDPTEGSYVGIVTGVVALSAACAYGLYGIGKLKGHLASNSPSNSGQPNPYAPANPYGPGNPYGQPNPYGPRPGGMPPGPYGHPEPSQAHRPGPWAPPAGQPMPPAGPPPQGPPPPAGMPPQGMPPGGRPPYGGPAQPPPPTQPPPTPPGQGRPPQGPPPQGPPPQGPPPRP